MSHSGSDIHNAILNPHPPSPPWPQLPVLSLPSPSLHAQMHLHSKVGDLSVLSGGGDVSIAVSPDAIVALTIKGSCPLQGDAAAGETQKLGRCELRCGGGKARPGCKRHPNDQKSKPWKR